MKIDIDNQAGMKESERMKTNKIYAVITKTLNGDPFASRRGEYRTRAEAKAHVIRWQKNGDEARILVEKDDGRTLQAPQE